MSDDFAAAAARMYPSHGAAPAPAASAAPAADTRQPVAAAEPSTGSVPAAAEPAAPRPPARWGECPPALPVQPKGVPDAPEPLNGAALMYDAPPGSVQDVQAIMALPDDPAAVEAAGFDVTPEARAERQEAATALHAAGLSTAEIDLAWKHAVRAAHPSWQAPSIEAADAALRQHFGDRYNDQMAAAREFYQGIVARSPAIKRHVTANGLDRSPEFIIALAKAATRRRAAR